MENNLFIKEYNENNFGHCENCGREFAKDVFNCLVHLHETGEEHEMYLCRECILAIHHLGEFPEDCVHHYFGGE